MRPYRAEHVGSLLRPQHLLDARERLEGDQYQVTEVSLKFDELRELEDAAIRDAVRLQEDVGLQAITDGEFRRRSWWQDFILELGGVTLGMAEDAAWTDPQGHKLSQRVVIVNGKIERTRPILADAFQFLKTVTKGTPKMTMPSPPIVHYYGGRQYIDETVYPDLDEFWADLTRAYREEIAGLAALGCDYVQLDECIFAILCDPQYQEQGTQPRPGPRSADPHLRSRHQRRGDRAPARHDHRHASLPRQQPRTLACRRRLRLCRGRALQPSEGGRVFSRI